MGGRLGHSNVRPSQAFSSTQRAWSSWLAAPETGAHRGFPEPLPRPGQLVSDGFGALSQQQDLFVAGGGSAQQAHGALWAVEQLGQEMDDGLVSGGVDRGAVTLSLSSAPSASPISLREARG